MKIFTIVNPRSGNGAGTKLAQKLSRFGEAQAIDFRQLDKQLSVAAASDCIVVGGGDGTLATVLTSLKLPERPILPVPLGTGNDLARELGITPLLSGEDRWNDLLSIVSDWKPRTVSTWQASVDQEVIPFINYCSLGFDGAVVEDVAHWRSRLTNSSRLLNRAMYSLLALRHSRGELRDLVVECDSQRYEVSGRSLGFIVANIRSYLGLGFSNRDGDPSDERLESISTSSVFDYLRIIAASSGLISPTSTICSGTSLVVGGVPSGTPLQVDGEFRRRVQGGRVEFSPRRKVTVLAPAQIATR